MERKPQQPPEAVAGPIDDLGAFGLLTNEQLRAVMLEIRHANGLRRAFGYSWLESADFNPSDGITLNFSGKVVKLVGRNLNAEAKPGMRLFESLLQHRVSWIQETDETSDIETAERDVVVDSVTVS